MITNKQLIEGFKVHYQNEPMKYFFTLFFRVGFINRLKISRSVMMFSRKLESALVGKSAVKKGLKFSLLPVLEFTKSGLAHIHGTVGGNFKPHLDSRKIKSIVADIWKQQEGTIPTSSHNPTGDQWFKHIDDPDAVISYMMKPTSDFPNITDKWLIDAFKLAHPNEIKRSYVKRN